MNRKLAMATSFTLVASAAALAAIGLRQEPLSTLKTSTYKAINATSTDLDGLSTLVLDQAYRSGSAAPIPAFDSKSLPAWAASKAALSVGRGTSKGARAWNVVSQAASRSWRYRVPASVVGKSFDTLPSNTVLIEVLNAPSQEDVPWIGVTVSGRLVKPSTAP